MWNPQAHTLQAALSCWLQSSVSPTGESSTCHIIPHPHPTPSERHFIPRGRWASNRSSSFIVSNNSIRRDIVRNARWVSLFKLPSSYFMGTAPSWWCLGAFTSTSCATVSDLLINDGTKLAVGGQFTFVNNVFNSDTKVVSDLHVMFKRYRHVAVWNFVCQSEAAVPKMLTFVFTKNYSHAPTPF